MEKSKESKNHIFYDESDFLSEGKSQNIPEELKDKIFVSMKNYVQPKFKVVAIKYSIAFIISGFISLLFCPQKGFGFLNEYPLFFHIFHTNTLLCGLYCGLFFGLLTHVIGLSILNYFERLSLFNSIRFLPHFWFGIFFGLFMFLGDEFYNLDLLYNISWIISVVFVLSTSQIFSRLFSKKIKLKF